MRKPRNLRFILAQNIKKARKSLHISQAKLAEFAEISVPHILDIEYCKTWVSDKTLNNIARALNMEVYELLIPDKSEENNYFKNEKGSLQLAASIINKKKKVLKKITGEIMDNLILEIAKEFGNNDR